MSIPVKGLSRSVRILEFAEDVNGKCFRMKGSFDKVIDMKTCFLQAELTNGLRLAVKEFAKQNGYSFYDIKNHRGFLRTVQLRICTTGEIMANIVFGYDDEGKRKQLMDFVL